MTEQALDDLAAATSLRTISLRYFNPIGASPDLTSGGHVPEPTHVLGQLVMAARGRPERFHDLRHRLSDQRRHRHP